jgi:hypothetical protein
MQVNGGSWWYVRCEDSERVPVAKELGKRLCNRRNILLDSQDADDGLQGDQLIPKEVLPDINSLYRSRCPTKY